MIKKFMAVIFLLIPISIKSLSSDRGVRDTIPSSPWDQEIYESWNQPYRVEIADDAVAHDTYKNLRTSIDFRVADFIPSSDLFREIYGWWNPTIQVEVAHDMSKRVQIWANLSYLYSRGKSDPLQIKTHVYLIPLSFGLKYNFLSRDRVDLYVGAGLSLAWIKEKNDCFLSNKESNVGGVLCGADIRRKTIKYSLFADYMIQHFTVNNPVQCNKKVNASGLMVGLGIGASF